MKSVISVTEMVTVVGLSRQRFNQLVKIGVFPGPDHDPATGRPFFLFCAWFFSWIFFVHHRWATALKNDAAISMIVWIVWVNWQSVPRS